MFMDDPMERVYAYAASEEFEEAVAEDGEEGAHEGAHEGEDGGSDDSVEAGVSELPAA